MIKRVMLAAALLMAAAALFPTWAETTLRIGLISDPDMLDPSLARTLPAALSLPRCATSWSISVRNSISSRNSRPIGIGPTTARVW